MSVHSFSRVIVSREGRSGGRQDAGGGRGAARRRRGDGRGISPALASRLKAEEATLDALRKKLAKLRVRAAAVPPDAGAEEAKGWLRALVSDLGMKDPDRLRATFARAFGPLVLMSMSTLFDGPASRVLDGVPGPRSRAL